VGRRPAGSLAAAGSARDRAIGWVFRVWTTTLSRSIKQVLRRLAAAQQDRILTED
jgi:hypothetical protein